MEIRDLHGKVLKVTDLNEKLAQVKYLLKEEEVSCNEESLYWSDVYYKLKNLWYSSY